MGYAGAGAQMGTAEAPVVPNFQIADLLGGALTPVMGILAALIDAKSSGRGRHVDVDQRGENSHHRGERDRKSTRLNSSHLVISYAVFCLKNKTPARDHV